MNSAKRGHVLMNEEEVQLVLPHRPPLLFVSAVITWDAAAKRVVSSFKVGEDHCQGHFPGNPIFPGVHFLEGMGQSACLAVHLWNPRRLDHHLPLAARSEEITLYKPAKPGDEIHFEVTLERIRSSGGVQFTGKAFVRREKVCEMKRGLLWLVPPKVQALV